jgi:F-type H+-transporting ATPase subunit a
MEKIDLMEHLQPHVIVPLKIGNIDVSITNAVVMMWIACILVFLTLFLAGRAGRLVPKGLQNLMESVVGYLRTNLIYETIGEKGMAWFPFIATLFFFILFCNLLGLVPKGFAATSNINVTASLAVVVFLCTQGAGIYKHGPFGYLKKFIPKGVPLWIIPLMLPIEIISQFAKPFSLAVRLFANMTAGHLVILVFLSMIIMFKSAIITPLPLAMAVIMKAFEIFISLIQAFIFSILASMYIAEAVHAEH